MAVTGETCGIFFHSHNFLLPTELYLKASWRLLFFLFFFLPCPHRRNSLFFLKKNMQWYWIRKTDKLLALTCIQLKDKVVTRIWPLN